MKTIRNNTFETNSSSCHSVTLISKSDYKSLQDKIKYPYDVDFWYEKHKSTIIKLPSDKLRTVEEIYQDLTNVLNDTTKEIYQDLTNVLNDTTKELSEYLQEHEKVVKENWSVDYVKKCLANPNDYDNDIINSFWEYFSYSDIASDKLKIISELDEIIDENHIEEFNDTYIFEGDIEC